MTIRFEILQRHDTQFVLIDADKPHSQIGTLNKEWNSDGWHFHALNGWNCNGLVNRQFDHVFDFESELYQTARYNNRDDTIEISISLKV